MRIAVFASHEGTTLQAILDACASETLPANVVLVISNNAGSGALRRATEAGVPTRHLSGRTNPLDFDEAILQALQAVSPDVVVLAGYMKQIGPLTLGAFQGRIWNTHPALLPSYGGQGMFGDHVHAAVLAAGETVSGASVHLVTANYDEGAVIARVEVAVLPTDDVASLGERVRAAERELLVDTLGRAVTLLASPHVHEATAMTAIQTGDVEALRSLLAEHPWLATARLDHHGGRTLLHVATDWPGHFPRVVDSIRLLVAAGVDVDALSVGVHPETPLHWAASSDDVDALDALIDAGADLEVGSGATPLGDAVAFGCWNAARRLVERGATATLWQAAALGIMPVLQSFFDDGPPTAEDITHAFWSACHGNQVEAAAYLLERGADLNRVGHDDLTPLDAAAREGATGLLDWLRARGALSAAELP